MRAQLLPTIGLSAEPINSASICSEQFYLGSFYASGYQVGDTVPDFKLYGLNGDSLVLSQSLASGKPALLIAGSLTCPVFRNKVAIINQVAAAYGQSVNIYVIYTIEAHPTDTSVYFGYVNVTSQNTSAGILFPESVTYGARKQMVDTMYHWVSPNVPVFIDGPCNEWWNYFGPAPNNSYLIGTNGVVLNKHGWFHKSPDHIFCDLDSILTMTSGLCVPVSTSPGNFQINVLNSSSAGEPAVTLFNYVDIVNTTTATTTIRIQKINEAIPLPWATSFCADICYSTLDDSIVISVDPLDTIHFSLDFYTGGTPDSGTVRVGFRNVKKSANAFQVDLKAVTAFNTTGISSSALKSGFALFPNPASDHVEIVTGETDFITTIFDATGAAVMCDRDRNIDLSGLPEGLYLVVNDSRSGRSAHRLIVCR
jgi:hypothetical protein